MTQGSQPREGNQEPDGQGRRPMSLVRRQHLNGGTVAEPGPGPGRDAGKEERMAKVHGHRDCGAVDVAGRLRRRSRRPGRAAARLVRKRPGRDPDHPTPADPREPRKPARNTCARRSSGPARSSPSGSCSTSPTAGWNPSVGCRCSWSPTPFPKDGRARTRRSGSSPTESSRRWRRPRATAGAGWVEVGGPNIAQQCLDLGLLDQVRVDLVPMLLGIEAPALPISPTRVCAYSSRTGRPRGGRGHHRPRPNTMPPPQQSGDERAPRLPAGPPLSDRNQGAGNAQGDLRHEYVA